MMRVRPLLVLDVDGVLNPSGPRAGPEPPWITFTDDWTGKPVALNPRHGERLLALSERTGCELVWGTSWEERANEKVAPRLGLPDLPVIAVSTEPPGLDYGVLWKTGHIAAYAAGRPFVWLDDHPGHLDSGFLAAHGAPDHLIIVVDPEVGLQDRHLDHAGRWLAARAQGPGQAAPGTASPENRIMIDPGAAVAGQRLRDRCPW
jgi:hypothetical protein